MASQNMASSDYPALLLSKGRDLHRTSGKLIKVHRELAIEGK